MSKGTGKKHKGRFSESKLLGSQPKDGDASGSDQDESGDEATNGPDSNMFIMLRKFVEKQLASGKNASARETKLESEIKTLFGDARAASAERKTACAAYLDNMLMSIESTLQTEQEPDCEEILKLLGARAKYAAKVTSKLEALPPINGQLDMATKQANDHLKDRQGLRARSRKRLIKHAQRDYERALEMQKTPALLKLATDANAYIKHYKRLIVL
ncbi:SubName: Full=Uncharacterized protein {ECO:0000313/EMBL:CCA66806.1} [Serendipita indica DSM 11827]|nr:SubName: Full=Uncharacterized protein {ECO:0000313/EMBL:CCA66806.1} [Serendipita indica DSM 11827]